MKKDFKKYLPWIVLLLLILSLSLWYVLSRRITEEQLLLYESKLTEAQAHVEARQFTMGVQKYNEAAEIIPSEIGAYEGIISILVTKNRLSEATDVIEQSARAINNYNKSILYKMVGDAYYNIQEYSKAYEMYDAGSFLGINNMELELMLGKTYINLGDINSARRQLSNSAYQDELLEEANLLLAYIYAIDDPQKANSTLNTLTEIEEIPSYYEEFQRVLDSLDDDKKFNSTKLARVYINNEYPYLAIRTLEPRKDEMTEYLEGMYFLGRAYFEYGRYGEAIEVLDRALTLGGMEEEILWIKARSYYLMNDLENATVSYDSAVGQMGPQINSSLVSEYVELLLENNQVLKALDLIRSLLILENELPYLHLLGVKINSDLDHSTRVDYHLGQLDQMELNDPDEKEFLKWKVRIALENDDVEEIEESLDRLFELDRFSPHYRFLLAQIQLQEGEEEMAIQSLERAIEYDLDYEITEDALRVLSSLQ